MFPSEYFKYVTLLSFGLHSLTTSAFIFFCPVCNVTFNSTFNIFSLTLIFDNFIITCLNTWIFSLFLFLSVYLCSSCFGSSELLASAVCHLSLSVILSHYFLNYIYFAPSFSSGSFMIHTFNHLILSHSS